MSKELVECTLCSEIVIFLPCDWTICSTGKSLPKNFGIRNLLLVNYSIRFPQLAKTKPCLTWLYGRDGRHNCKEFALPANIWTGRV